VFGASRFAADPDVVATKSDRVCRILGGMGRKGVEKTWILDANDVVWWVGFGFLATIPLFVVYLLDWPFWVGVPIALLVGGVAAPLRRRYERRTNVGRQLGGDI
jgi:hypothetical protein